ncbi:MAG: DUF1131 family protein [Gammaproteobacteria bacterium]
MSHGVGGAAAGSDRATRGAVVALICLVFGASGCSVKFPALSGAKSGANTLSSALAPTLSGNGLGSLGALSPFEESSVRATLNRFDISERLLETRYGLEPVLVADYEGDPAVEVYADASGRRVGRIDLVGPALAGPDGLRVGSELRLQPRKGFACAPGGPEGLQGRAICARSDDQRLTYVYDHDWYENEDELPPPEILVRARLERMIWTAKPS